MIKYIILVLLLFPLSAKAQSRKLWGSVDIAYGYSLAQKKDMYGVSHPSSNSYSNIQGVMGYYLTPNFSIGIGVGLSGYSNPGLNCMPLFANLKVHPFLNKKISLNSDIGYSVLSNEAKIKAGFYTNISVGYKVWEFKKISLIPALGYNFCHYNITTKSENKIQGNRNSLFLKLSIMY